MGQKNRRAHAARRKKRKEKGDRDLRLSLSK
jgi:hypothetical protein